MKMSALRCRPLTVDRQPLSLTELFYWSRLTTELFYWSTSTILTFLLVDVDHWANWSMLTIPILTFLYWSMLTILTFSYW